MRKLVLSTNRCKKCGLFWCKNFQHFFSGGEMRKRHIGFFHRCGASESGAMDGTGPIVRVDLQMRPSCWTEKRGCEPKSAGMSSMSDGAINLPA